MLRLAADERLNGIVTDGLFRREHSLDLVRIQDATLLGARDPRLLVWAAANGRILISSDEKTLPRYAFDRVRDGEPMPGVFMVPQDLPIGDAIDDLLLLALWTEHDEWKDQVVWLPI
jgi:Domain of unknown function (DUF5615)